MGSKCASWCINKTFPFRAFFNLFLNLILKFKLKNKYKPQIKKINKFRKEWVGI